MMGRVNSLAPARMSVPVAAFMLAAASTAPAWADDKQPKSGDAPAAAEPAPDPARVREADPLRAQRLFDDGLSLLDTGRWAEACPKFRESMAAEPAVGTLLNVARCSDHEGLVLQAARELRRVLELNAKTADAERRKVVDGQAQAALTELEKKLGRVIVRVLPANASGRIMLDGNPTPAALPGEATEVLAGPHTIQVSAVGYRSVERKIVVAGGADETLSITLEPLPSDDAAGPRGDRAGSSLATAGWVTGLAGAGVISVGAVLLGAAGQKAAEIGVECGSGAVPPSCPEGSADVANELASEGQSLATGGIIALAAGGALVVAGITIVIVDATSVPAAATGQSPRPAMSVSLRSSPGGANVSFVGGF